MRTKEIKIPAPWGHIAAKTWGCEHSVTIICVHGILDNAGSFDTLIPLLPECFYYVCVDLAGHGLSSHYDKSLPVTFHNLLLSIKVVCDFLSRETYIFFGHSLGAGLLVTHCQLYPKSVSKLILIDGTYALPTSPKQYLEKLENAYSNLKNSLKYKVEERPLISYHEAVEKVMKSRFHGILTYNTAEQITRRMVQKVDDQYRFTYDPRLKTIIEPPLNLEYIEKLLKIRPLECPVILFPMTETFKKFKSYEFAMRYMDVIKDAEKHIITGNHHSHHTNPELIATHISKFLLKDHHKL